MSRSRFVAVVAAAGVLSAIPGAAAPTTGYSVVRSFPHDPGAFTQGLDFYGGKLFETTGQNPASLRRVRLRTGEVLREVRLNQERHFGEGMTIKNGKLYWITWKSERAFVYDPDTFQRLRSFRYRGEGWGLTHNRRRLIMSNGSDRIMFRDPKTFEIRRRIQVTDEGEPVDRLNELEWVRGEIFANIFTEDLIARIDPRTGDVTGWIDLTELRAGEPDGVTNGIAYKRKQDRLFVTGKNWANLYEIDLID